MHKIKSLYKKSKKYCPSKAESRRTVEDLPQRIIIRPGLVNPAEPTIVEVPAELQNVETVIAKPKSRSPSPAPPSRASPAPSRRPSPSPRSSPAVSSRASPAASSRSSPAQTSRSRRSESYRSGPTTPRPPFPPPRPPTPPRWYQGFCPGRMSTPTVPATRTELPDMTAWPYSQIEEETSFIPQACPCRKCAGLAGSLTAAGPSNTPQRDLMLSIDQLELQELDKIQKSLRDFQSSRRKLIFDAASLSSSANQRELPSLTPVDCMCQSGRPTFRESPPPKWGDYQLRPPHICFCQGSITFDSGPQPGLGSPAQGWRPPSDESSPYGTWPSTQSSSSGPCPASRNYESSRSSSCACPPSSGGNVSSSFQPNQSSQMSSAWESSGPVCVCRHTI